MKIQDGIDDTSFKIYQITMKAYPSNNKAFVSINRWYAYRKQIRSTMNKPLHWFSLVNHDKVEWKVQLSSQEISPDLAGKKGSDGNYGITDSSQKIILIDAKEARRIQDYITLHEVMHVSLEGIDGIPYDMEERIILKMAPNLFPILQQFGLKWPERSDELLALERRARRNKK